MNSQPNCEIPPPLDSHHWGLQITLQVGRKLVGSSVGGLSAHSVYRILHQNVGSLIASWILNRIPKFHHRWIPTIKGYISNSGSIWTDQQPVSSLVSAFGVHSVYWILNEYLALMYYTRSIIVEGSIKDRLIGKQTNIWVIQVYSLTAHIFHIYIFCRVKISFKIQ